MRTTLHLENAYGTPMAMKGPDGEWVEVGYVTNLDLTVEQDEHTLWETPFRAKREYRMSVDLTAKESAYYTLMAIIRGE
jgi:hypothetical protein